MSNAQHTPGPWTVSRTHQSPCSIEAGSGEVALAKVYLTDPKTRKRSPEYAANAALIAAAPELLAALQNLIMFPLGSFQVEAALKAIAKAKGE